MQFRVFSLGLHFTSEHSRGNEGCGDHRVRLHAGHGCYAVQDDNCGCRPLKGIHGICGGLHLTWLSNTSEDCIARSLVWLCRPAREVFRQ